MSLVLFTCFRNMKVNLRVDVSFTRPLTDGVTSTSASFTSPALPVFNESEIEDVVEASSNNLMSRLEAFTSNGSGWVVNHLTSFSVLTAAYDPIGGSSFVPLPKFIRDKKAVLNIKNRDQNCFFYCLLAHAHPISRFENANRVSMYVQYLPELNINGITTPVYLDEIPKFEKLNPHYSVNVLSYGQDDNKIFPLYVSKFRNRQHHVNLLLMAGLDESGHDYYHYALTRDVSRLLSNRSKTKRRQNVCPYCLHRFSKKDALDRHIPECSVHPPCRIRFPTGRVRGAAGAEERAGENQVVEGGRLSEADREHIAQMTMQYTNDNSDEPDNILRFRNFRKTFPVPFYLVADFESFIEENDSKTQIHTPSGYCCLRVSSYPHLNHETPVTYSGENVMENFYEHIKSEGKKIDEILKVQVPMKPLTSDQKRAVAIATHCECCKGVLSVKYKHHDHVTGDFLGTVCNRCNLQLKPVTLDRGNSYMNRDRNYFIPIIIHNCKNCDARHILKYLKK